MAALFSKPKESRHPLDGVNGWLALFLAIVALQSLLLAWETPELFKDIITTAQSSWRDFPVTGPMAFGGALFPFIFILVAAWGIVLTVRRSERTPAFWGWFLLAVFVYKAIDGMFAGMLVRQVAGHVSAADLEAFREKAWNGVVDDLRYMLWTAIWTWYWNNSERVRITFGRNTWARPLPVTAAEAHVAEEVHS